MSARASSRKRRQRRHLRVEQLEARCLFAIEITVAAPVVSAFPAAAEVTGLELSISSQPATIRTIDSNGLRQVLREIDGVLYSASNNQLFETNTSSGITQSRTLTPLSGANEVRVRDIARVNGQLVLVGASVQVNGSSQKTPRPTRWDINGIPVAVGPADVVGELTFVNPEGIMGGYYRKSDGEYVPLVHSSLGNFTLAGAVDPTNLQSITGGSATGYFLSGYSNDVPLFWRADAAPVTGNFELIFSDEIPLLYPDDAALGNSASKFRIAEDSLGSVYIFGQYDLPVIVGGQINRYETHAAMWSISGDLIYDFGPNTEMLGVQNVDTTYIVAHRNSISLVEISSVPRVTTLALSSLIPGTIPNGTNLQVLQDGLVLIGQSSGIQLGINYAETASSQTQNKLLIVQLRNPQQLDLDVDGNGSYETNLFGFEMRFPTFVPLGYGQKSLNARVTYSDGSTSLVSTNYEALRYASITEGSLTVLRIGGTANDDQATLTKLGDRSYRAAVGGQSQDFSSIDQVVLELSSGNDTLNLAGGVEIELSAIGEAETIDMTGLTTETLIGVDPLAVAFQVGATGTLRIKSDPADIIDLDSNWQLGGPQVIDGRPGARLTADGKVLLWATGHFSNPLNSLDATFDGFITARDALLIINHINQVSGGLTPTIEAYLDTSDDGFVTALDVLLIINHINTNGAGEGEMIVDALQPEAWVGRGLDVGPDSTSELDRWLTDLELVERATRRWLA